MSEIADFLRARYAERRALAAAASPGPWHVNEEADEVLAVDGITVAEGFALSGRQLRATVDHIAANDPDGVIADLDAKVALIDLFERTPVTGPGDPVTNSFIDGWKEALEEALKVLAQPFAGHLDHRGEEWAP